MKVNLVIATPEFDKLSETFITRHRDELPFRICTLSGRPFRFAGRDKQDLTFQSPWVRLQRRIGSRVGIAFNANEYQKSAIGKWLENESQAAVVLGEYGMYAKDLVEPCRSAGIPLIVHFHGFDAFNRVQISRVLDDYQKMFDFASALVAVSGSMKTRLIELGAPPEKVKLIPYPFDPKFQCLANPAVTEPHYLAVGRFVEKKGPFLTILAFRDVVLQIPEARLTFIGDGALRGPCETLVEALGLANNVIFRGALPHKEVGEAMKTARCFVQHSVEALDGDCEGTPLAVLEAQAAGLPVVSTYHSGIQEAVADGETGFLVHEKDICGMAARMIDLGNDAHLAQQMGQIATERVRDLYSVDRTLGRLASLISEISGLQPITGLSDRQ